MEMKLELKHLSPYLPYGLKVIDDEINETFDVCGINISDNELLINDNIDGSVENYCIDILKPILRPLSDLTKEIEVNGERFIPLFNICKLQGFSIGKISDWKFTFNTEFNKTAMMNNGDWIFRYLDREKSFWLNGIAEFNRKHQKSNRQLQCFEKLFEWHFDVFGWIESGLAININTLNK